MLLMNEFFGEFFFFSRMTPSMRFDDEDISGLPYLGMEMYPGFLNISCPMVLNLFVSKQCDLVLLSTFPTGSCFVLSADSV